MASAFSSQSSKRIAEIYLRHHGHIVGSLCARFQTTLATWITKPLPKFDRPIEKADDEEKARHRETSNQMDRR